MSDASFSGDAAVVDGTAIGAGTGAANVIGGVYNDSVAALGSGNGGFARLTSARALHANLRDASGNVVLVTSETTGYAIAVGGATAHDAVDAGNPQKIGGYASQAAPSAISADGDRVNAWFDRYGRLTTKLSASGTVVTQVASSASNVTLKAANTARLGITVMNDSTAVLYLKMGATASATSYTVKLVAGAYWEAPYGYTGIVDGIWASANGYAYVTEVTS